jgi:alpha-L-fucosidase 2
MPIAAARTAKQRGIAAMLCILAVLVLVPFSAHAQSEPSALTLWYDAPAADWERGGLPIGNGAMGAMLMGGVAVDDIQFNEKTL